jgi:predicted DNA-binding protein
MRKVGTSNLHVPLPGSLHQRLRAEAIRSGRPATTLAREAIEDWLRQREREQVSDAITAYAHEAAATGADLDQALERAGTEHLTGKRRKR